MGCFKVILKPHGYLSTILITKSLITIIIIDQDTISKYLRACHWRGCIAFCCPHIKELPYIRPLRYNYQLEANSGSIAEGALRKVCHAVICV